MEAFSKVHFSIPLFIFIPVIGYFMYKAIFLFHEPALSVLFLFAGGIVVWSLAEYVMHRFIFHYEPSSDYGKRLHFIFHGIHHDYPNDANRLVMAPSVSIPLAVLFYYSFLMILGEQDVASFFSGFVTGYLCYDMTHYAIHHFSFKNGWWMKLKKHHMLHHYQDGENGYGVSSKVWDVIFGTNHKKQAK
jgi:sterol desaturase/sphingolipid hydroxylase (fatty acid hydroxylase superfamily)